MYVTEVYVKDTNELRWMEDYLTKEQMLTELQHMKENHFNPEYFRFESYAVDLISDGVETKKLIPCSLCLQNIIVNVEERVGRICDKCKENPKHWMKGREINGRNSRHDD